MDQDVNDAHEHQAGENQEVQADQRVGQSLVVAGDATEARHPGDRSLDDPTAGQQHEAPLGLGRLDHLQADAVRGRVAKCAMAFLDGTLNRSPIGWPLSQLHLDQLLFILEPLTTSGSRPI